MGLGVTVARGVAVGVSVGTGAVVVAVAGTGGAVTCGPRALQLDKLASTSKATRLAHRVGLTTAVRRAFLAAP
jgi:hypothetical protein